MYKRARNLRARLSEGVLCQEGLEGVVSIDKKCPVCSQSFSAHASRRLLLSLLARMREAVSHIIALHACFSRFDVALREAKK